MVEYIKNTFEDLKLYYSRIHLCEDCVYLKEEDKVWTKEKIYDCIVEEADHETYHI